ncbi:MAG: patatin-like phospholipase family protein [Frankiaceae bacterium]
MAGTRASVKTRGGVTTRFSTQARAAIGVPPPAGQAESGRPRRGLVLGAGGVLGAAWMVGALSALQEERGFDPRSVDIVIGTSAGSILAAFLGSGVSVEAMVDHQRGISAEGDTRIDYDYEHDARVLPPKPKMRLGSGRLLASTALHPRRVTPLMAFAAVAPLGRGSLQPVADMVRAVAPSTWPSAPRVWLVAMDYARGVRVPLGQAGAPAAALPDAVMASCAIPGWYAPVRIGDRLYVDGGACSATSLDLLAPLGLDEVYVLAPMAAFSMDAPNTVIVRLERRLRRSVTARLLREATDVRSAGTQVTMLAPGPEDLEIIGANMMDPRRREAVFDTSLRTSRAALTVRSRRSVLSVVG